MTDLDRYIEVEGDVPKVEPTLRYFAELRASLKNGLDVTSDLGMEVARWQADLIRAARREQQLREALIDQRKRWNLVSTSLTMAGVNNVGRKIDYATDAIDKVLADAQDGPR